LFKKVLGRSIGEWNLQVLGALTLTRKITMEKDWRTFVRGEGWLILSCIAQVD